MAHSFDIQRAKNPIEGTNGMPEIFPKYSAPAAATTATTATTATAATAATAAQVEHSATAATAAAACTFVCEKNSRQRFCLTERLIAKG